MDYEDDDFQSQSFQLASEGNIRFSTDLHLFPLPKFDLDDSLQVHPRFDSLVESEVLLGIQGQEENQWVGNFSRESSGLEFSSSAAESCSISRCHNVWSEATSSESVDLLLKSVGQDEIIMGETIIQESDVCGEMGIVENTPNSNQDGLAQSEIGNGENMVFELCPEKCSASSSGLGKDAMKQVPQVDATLPPGESVKSGNCSFPCSADEKCNKEVSETSLFNVETCNETKQKEESPLDDISERNKIMDDCVQVDPSEALRQSSAANFGNLISQNVTLQAEDLEKDYAENMGDGQGVIKEFQMKSQCSGINTVETVAINVEDMSSLALKAHSVVQMTEVSGGASHTQNAIEIKKWVRSEDQFTSGLEEKGIGGDNHLILHSSDLDSSVTGIASNQVDVYHSGQIKQGHNNLESSGERGNLLDGHHLGGEVAVSNIKSLPVKDQTVSHDQNIQSSKADVEDYPSSVVVSSLSTKVHELQRTENIKDSGDDSITHSADSSVMVNISSPIRVDSMQICIPNSTETKSSDVHISHPDVSALGMENVDKSVPTDVDVESERDNLLMIGKRASSDSFGVPNADISVVAHISSQVEVESLQICDQMCTKTGPSDLHVKHLDVSSLAKENDYKMLPTCLVNVENVSGDSFTMDKTTDDLGVKSADFGVEAHVSSPIQESMEKYASDLTETVGIDAHIPDICALKTENENRMLTTDSVNVGSESDGSFIVDSADGLGVHGGDIVMVAHFSSSMPKDDLDRTEKEPNDVHITHPDVSDLEKDYERKQLSTVSVIVDSKINVSVMTDEGQNSISIGQCDVTTGHESVGDITESTEAVPELIDLASDNDYHHSSIRRNVAKDEGVEGNEDVKSPLSDSVLLVKKEETVTNISMESCFSIAKERPQMSMESDPYYEFEKGSACDNAGEMEPETGHSLSQGLVTNTCHDETSDYVADMSVQQGSKTEECSVVHDSPMKENDCSEICEKHEGASTAISVGVPLSGHPHSSVNTTVAEGDGEVRVTEAGTNIFEPNCGSPTIISSCDASQSGKEYYEGRTGSLDQISSCSDYIEQEAHKVTNIATHSKDNDNTSGDDKSFTFKVSPRSNLSEKETGGGWQPFPNVPPYGAQNSGEKDVCRSPKGDAEDKKKIVAGEAAGREISGGKPLEDELTQSEKELQGLRVPLDQTTIVSDCPNQLETAAPSISQDCKENRATEVDRRFPFEVCSPTHLSGSGTCGKLKQFSSVEPCEISQTVEVSHSTKSSVYHADSNMLQNSRECPRTSGVKNARKSPKGNAQEKTRPLSSKADENFKEGRVFIETIPMKPAKERVSNSLNAFPSSPGVVSSIVQAEEKLHVGNSEGGGMKTCVVSSSQTSNLPNTSPSSAVAQQPFTDFQQVQLRAQIFVYGSLIQGTAPDEACMVAAFGESGGGRSSWENVWRVSVDKLYNQKSPFNKPETPRMLSGSRVLELGTRQIANQREADCTPCQAGGKGTTSSITTTIMHPSSPLWTVSTPFRDGMPLSSNPMGSSADFHKPLLPIQPHQSPHARQLVGSTTPWLSPPPSGTWLFTPQTATTNAHVQSPSFPISDTVHVTSVREPPGSLPSGMQHSPASPFNNNGISLSGPEATTQFVDAKRKTMVPNTLAFSETKRRKRKKSLVPEEFDQISSLVQPQMDSVYPTVHSSAAFSLTTPITSAPKVVSNSLISSSLPESSTNYQILGAWDLGTSVVFSEEMSRGTEQAKRQAEDAAIHAASAAKHNQNLWSQLANQQSSGVALDVEAKLASLAVAVAAAASVAKAAAAAAKVASGAALQAKLMADEALATRLSGVPTPEASIHDSVKKTGNVTSASILKGIDRTENPDLVLVAAREAARKRVETASAAAKRAENLDAILKAAQMAAEAVSQAGTIIAMGEPIPLTISELVNAGPEGYWKVRQTSSEQHIKSKYINTVAEGLDKQKETKQTPDQEKLLKSIELSKNLVENHVVVNGMQKDSVTTCGMESGAPKDCKKADLPKTVGVIPNSQIGSANVSTPMQNDVHKDPQLVRSSIENNIKEGSVVEVLPNNGSLKKVWVSANVLSLKDGEANVSYIERLPDQGSGQLMEWVPLEVKGGKAPRIRIAYPESVAKFEKTKKRRRAARGDYTWFVGDKVDAWVDNGWREGIITEINKEDETNLTVSFPDQGDSSVVKAWHLRPSFVWENGQWIEWCRLMGNNVQSYEGETPQGKPTKKSRLGPVDLDREKDSMSNNLVMEEARKCEISNNLELSLKEKVFTVGNNTKGDTRSDAVRTKRAGLQKEGSAVIFGVPKPGKKRKFMDVSKHYVAEKSSKISTGNDSIKVTDFLIPQDTASRGWKTTSKNVSKGKSFTESKPKVINSVRTQRIAGRTVPDKDDSSQHVVADKGTAQDHLVNAKFSARHDGNTSQKPTLQAIGSFPNISKTTEGAASHSSLDAASDPLSARKKSSSAVASDPKGKGKAGPSGARSVINDKKDKDHNDNPRQLLPNAVEPRRSNRKIQPTSRLLEGIQSSMVISKIPSFSHEKGVKSQQRNSASKG